MILEYTTVADFGLDRAAEVLTRGFSDYFVKIPFTSSGLLQAARVDGIDLASSLVVSRDGAPVGAALVSRRGWTSRLAGMALVPEARRGGVGRALVTRLLEDARGRGEREMVLEVIEQNEPAVKLYEACGFSKVRRLLGFVAAPSSDLMIEPRLEEVDVRELARRVAIEGLPDLPWQLSAETLAHQTPPTAAYQLDGAWVAVANITASGGGIRALVTERGQQGRGRGAAVLRAVMARFPGREWRMSALWPEELAAVFLEAGFARTPLSQWQMRRVIGA